ncbi:hypothetical protein PHYPSEUDO_004645 [Phytophthora pseudosyringae]|uniref:Uncharacterized protein n=1 Tax=Phytophthora pseudosyringae TaxID=221518 RepID=A0A8T1VMV8_9STRA|nr:hypothetical protein PHYPSEUDO_004645 [Phytophthora pseudosyringae]
MEALNELVLALVPTQQLHQSYNAVLQEEFASVATSVDDVVAAFAKLEEVRDATAQLEQGHESTGGRSASLMAATANTTLLQCELQKRADKLATGMAVKMLERKRKREEEIDQVGAVTSTRLRTVGAGGSGDLEATDSTNPLKKLASDAGMNGSEEETKTSSQVTRCWGKRLRSHDTAHETQIVSVSKAESSCASELESGNDDSGGGGVEAALMALMAKGVVNSGATLGKSETRDVAMGVEVDTSTSGIDGGSTSKPTGMSATIVKAIVEDVNSLSPLDRTFVIRDVLIALKETVEEDIGATQPSDVASSLNILIGWWAGEYEDQVEHLQWYREYVAAMKSYMDWLPSSMQKSELQGLIDTLCSAIKSFKGLPKPGMQTKSTNRATQESALQLSSVVGSVDSLAFARRQRELLRILVTLKKDTVSKVDDARGKRIFKPMSKVFRWVCQDPREPYPLHIYRMLVRAARQATRQISGAAERKAIAGLLDRMSEVVADPSSRKTRKFLDDIRLRAVKVLESVSGWYGKRVPEREVGGLIDAVEKLVNHTTYGWDPRQDHATRKCVLHLKRIVKKSNASDSRLAMIAKWKIDAPPTKVKTPKA